MSDNSKDSANIPALFQTRRGYRKLIGLSPLVMSSANDAGPVVLGDFLFDVYTAPPSGEFKSYWAIAANPSIMMAGL